MQTVIYVLNKIKNSALRPLIGSLKNSRFDTDELCTFSFMFIYSLVIAGKSCYHAIISL